MTRHLLVVGAAVAALSIAACNREAQDTATAAATPDANPAATVPTMANEAAAPDYVAKAAAGDMLEIETSKIALTRATDPKVKAFARMMIDAHTKSTADLKAALTASGLPITPPAALPDDMKKKVDDLNAVAAADFDRNYMDHQVDAHQAALDLHTRYAEDGDNAQLRAAAAMIAPVVQQHYTEATTLRDGLK